MNLGNTIRTLRKERGLTQGALAKEIGISQTSLYKIERDGRRPTAKTLAKLCKVLGVPETILYLYGLEEEDIPDKKKETYRLLFPSIQDMIKKLVAIEE